MKTGMTIRDLEKDVARIDGLADAATLHETGILLNFPPVNPRVSYAVDRINRLDVLRLKAAFAICAFKKQAHIARLQNNPNSALELMAEAEKLEEVVEYFAAEIKAVRL
jgi:hypothetical protein